MDKFNNRIGNGESLLKKRSLRPTPLGFRPLCPAPCRGKGKVPYPL